MKTKHTPGPWQFAAQIGSMMFPPVGYSISEMKTGHQITECSPYKKMPIETQQANARLIAACPEMLKMLELAICELEWADKNCQIKPMAGVSTFKTAVAQIKTVIAKATGDE